MKQLKLISRLLYINYVLLKHGLDEIVLSMRWFYPLRFLIYINPIYWSSRQKEPRGVRIRKALEELGPIFVKFGQMLSTRHDLLLPDIIKELTKLQDRVPAFGGETAKAIIEKRLGKPVTELFQMFEIEPLASASMAQVHAGVLPNGQNVVIKVLRPGIKELIQRDIDLLLSVAKLAERYWGASEQFRPYEIVCEFQRCLADETNFLHEAANASQLRRNFLNSPMLYVPEIYWPYTKDRIIVMERIYGIPVTNLSELKAKNIDVKELAQRGTEIFFTQVFRDNFFHADMHPGNIFVNPNKADDPQYIAIDFGIMGALSTNDQRYLAENLYAFFKRDYHRVAELHVESGWVHPDTRVDAFESAIRTVCEPIFERPLKDISFGQLLFNLFETARQFKMEIQPQLVLLQKTLLSIEGLGRQLYPDLNLWDTAQPYLENWIKEQVGLKAMAKSFEKNIPYWTEKVPEFPKLAYQILEHANKQILHQNIKKASEKRKTPTSKPFFITGLGLALVSGGLLNLLTIKHAVLSVSLLTQLNWLLVAGGGLVLLINFLSKK